LCRVSPAAETPAGDRQTDTTKRKAGNDFPAAYGGTKFPNYLAAMIKPYGITAARYWLYFRIVGCWLCLLIVLPAAAEKQFDFNTACQQAYREIIQLKLTHGQQLLDAPRSNVSNPGLVIIAIGQYPRFGTG